LAIRADRPHRLLVLGLSRPSSRSSGHRLGQTLDIHVPMEFERRGGRKETVLPPGGPHESVCRSRGNRGCAFPVLNWRGDLRTGNPGSSLLGVGGYSSVRLVAKNPYRQFRKVKSPASSPYTTPRPGVHSGTPYGTCSGSSGDGQRSFLHARPPAGKCLRRDGTTWLRPGPRSGGRWSGLLWAISEVPIRPETVNALGSHPPSSQCLVALAGS